MHIHFTASDAALVRLERLGVVGEVHTSIIEPYAVTARIMNQVHAPPQ